MNIAFLLRLYPIYGGGETVTLNLANEMARRGHNIYIVYFKENGHSDNIHLQVKSIQINGYVTDEWHIDTQHAEEIQNQLQEIIIKNNIEYIINQWWPTEYISNIGDNTKAKLIYVHHMNIFQEPIIKGNDLKSKLKKKILSIL